MFAADAPSEYTSRRDLERKIDKADDMDQIRDEVRIAWRPTARPGRQHLTRSGLAWLGGIRHCQEHFANDCCAALAAAASTGGAARRKRWIYPAEHSDPAWHPQATVARGRRHPLVNRQYRSWVIRVARPPRPRASPLLRWGGAIALWIACRPKFSRQPCTPPGNLPYRPTLDDWPWTHPVQGLEV